MQRKVGQSINIFAVQFWYLKRTIILFLAMHFFMGMMVTAQTVNDTTIIQTVNSPGKTDTSRSIIISKRPGKDSAWDIDRAAVHTRQFTWEILRHHPYFGFSGPVVFMPASDIRQAKSKELLFYILIALFLGYAFLRNLFAKYFADLFRLFFKTTIKQRQIREQLMQTPLPSLLLNVFFVISGGLYLGFLIQHSGDSPVDHFWLLVFYCCMGLSAAYLVKFIGLKISGWLFNMPEAANAYIFIVFIVNKMIGILLLPFILFMAFSSGNMYMTTLLISWVLIAGLLLYRFILTYAAIRNQVKVNPFHFFLYLCAFEIAPLLLVYKGLLLFFSRTT